MEPPEPGGSGSQPNPRDGLKDPTMNYTQMTDQQRQEMLQAVGVERIEQLYASLPPRFRVPADEPIELAGVPADGLSELDIRRRLEALGASNQPAVSARGGCFLGGGVYDHFIPAAVDHLAHQSEFVTAYTPYQAEASQGALQAFFEFQSQVCALTGLDAANASLYEGATAAAEAVMLALNVTGKRRVLAASTLHPQTLRVLATYLGDLPVELVIVEADAKTGRLTGSAVAKATDGDTAAVVVQSPNVWGLIEDWAGLFAAGKEAAAATGKPGQGPLAIAVFNPMACGLLKGPGSCGADVATAEGQPLGIPMSYGGPYLGLFACRAQYMRRMPGRLVGQTTDKQGRRAFCLTLQTREQHIRGAKATSNICTNQGLLAVRATIYMSAMGPTGLREAARQNYDKAHYAAGRIAALDGWSLAFDGPFFNEFAVDGPVDAATVIDVGRSRGIMPGIAAQRLGGGPANRLLVAVTEKRTRDEIEGLVRLLAEAGQKGGR